MVGLGHHPSFQECKVLTTSYVITVLETPPIFSKDTGGASHPYYIIIENTYLLLKEIDGALGILKSANFRRFSSNEIYLLLALSTTQNKT